jgi:hypothetical protein
MFRPGAELFPMFISGRVLISNEPDFMKTLPAGALAETSQELSDDPALTKLFTDERVISAAGGIDVLENWLSRRTSGCQWADDGYHMSEMTFRRHSGGSVRLCWHHDNLLRDQEPKLLGEIAKRNRAEWILYTVSLAFRFPDHHQITLPELCWWAAINNVIAAMPEAPARQVLRWKPIEIPHGVMRECDIEPIVSATSELEERVKPVLALKIDSEPPESFMLRPKRRRWANEHYTRWVKTQPCAGCGNQSDDPHHLIGYGQGGMGTKAHDLFTIPLCRKCHNVLHRDTRAFESENGNQLLMLLRTLDHALALGVIATGKE